MGLLIKKKHTWISSLRAQTHYTFYSGRGLYPPDWLNVNPDSWLLPGTY